MWVPPICLLSFPSPLCHSQAIASPAMVAAAMAHCLRLGSIPDRVIAVSEMSSVLMTCAAALSNPAVAMLLLDAVANICFHHSSRAADNRVTCATAGVIPVVVAAMCGAYGPPSARVAEKGCWALASLAIGNTANVDVMVLSAGALDAILSAMLAHVGDRDVQWRACYALWLLADDAGPSALSMMRGARAVELLEAAKGNHIGYYNVQNTADRALAKLRL